LQTFPQSSGDVIRLLVLHRYTLGVFSASLSRCILSAPSSMSDLPKAVKAVQHLKPWPAKGWPWPHRHVEVELLVAADGESAVGTWN